MTSLTIGLIHWYNSLLFLLSIIQFNQVLKEVGCVSGANIKIFKNIEILLEILKKL